MGGQRRPDYQADGVFRLLFGTGWLIGWVVLGFGFGPPSGDPRRWALYYSWLPSSAPFIASGNTANSKDVPQRPTGRMSYPGNSTLR